MRSLDWHPEGRQLLANYGHHTPIPHCELKIWDTASGDELLGWPTGYDSRATFSPDGSRVVWGAAKITDLKTGKVVSSFPQSNAVGSARSTWSPSGDRLARPVIGGAIKIWDTANGMEVSSTPAFAPRAEWSPKGTLLAGATWDGMVKVWDTATAGETVTLRTPGRHALSVAFSPDGHRILAGTRFGLLKVCDVETGEETLSVQQTEPTWIRSVRWSPDGKRFAAVGPNKAVVCYDLTGKQVPPLLEFSDQPLELAWSPDGKTLAVGLRSGPGGGRGYVRLFDASTGKEVAASGQLKGSCDSIAWRPDGKRLAAAAGGGVHVWDSGMREEQVIETVTCMSLGWSPDGKQLAVGGWGGRVWIYDAANSALLYKLESHAGPVDAVAWHPHMARLASGARDDTIKIWDTSTRQLLCMLDAHAGRINELDWSSDGLRLASASHDETVRIWDASPAFRFLKMHGDLREEVCHLVDQSEHQEAIEVLQRLRSLHPEENELETQIRRVKWLQAAQLARDGQLDEAVAVYKRLSAESADLPDHRLQLPAVLFDAARETEAIRMLEESVAEFPETHEYQDELAFLYERRAIQFCVLGRLEEATPIIVKLAKDFPERLDFRVELAFQAAEGNRLEETMAALGKDADTFSKWPDFRPELARRLAGNREFAMAVSIYEQLSAEFPDVPEYRSELSKLLDRTKDQQDPKPEEKREPPNTNSPTQ